LSHSKLTKGQLLSKRELKNLQNYNSPSQNRQGRHELQNETHNWQKHPQQDEIKAILDSQNRDKQQFTPPGNQLPHKSYPTTMG
jgi:hypothetical protein